MRREALKIGRGSSPMTIVHRTQFSATVVLCGASIFAYPAIAWGACAPATVDTGAPLVATDQLLEQVRQRREQQATVSMFSAAGSSAAAAPASKPGPSAAAPTATGMQQATVSMFSAAGSSVVKVSTAARPLAPPPRRRPDGAVFGRGCAKDRVAPNGMLKRRPPQNPVRVRLPQNSILLRAIRIADTL